MASAAPQTHILVVEDHAPLREQIVALLVHAGYRVDEAADGRMALRSLLAEPPDLLLLDLGLPGLDGVSLCEQLRQRAPQHVPVLMLTAHDSLADKLQGFAAGADDYLVKPFASEELVVRVQALLRRKTVGQDYMLRIGNLQIGARARGVGPAGPGRGAGGLGIAGLAASGRVHAGHCGRGVELAAVAVGLWRAVGAGLASPSARGRYRMGSASCTGELADLRLAGRLWLAAAAALAAVVPPVARACPRLLRPAQSGTGRSALPRPR